LLDLVLHGWGRLRQAVGSVLRLPLLHNIATHELQIVMTRVTQIRRGQCNGVAPPLEQLEATPCCRRQSLLRIVSLAACWSTAVSPQSSVARVDAPDVMRLWTVRSASA
jgi:hypothetical protein